MTKGEAKRILEFDLDHTFNDESKEALRIAIKALEQEPCEDAISRQAALDFIDAGHLINPNEPRWSDNEVVNFLKSRPSVTPTEKTGHWIEGNYHIRCSECGEDYPYRLRNYCPNCGAKMIELQESEVNNG